MIGSFIILIGAIAAAKAGQESKSVFHHESCITPVDEERNVFTDTEKILKQGSRPYFEEKNTRVEMHTANSQETKSLNANVKIENIVGTQKSNYSEKWELGKRYEVDEVDELIDELEERLEVFSSHLRSFFSDTSFDIVSFGLVAQDLQEKLDHLCENAKKFPNSTKLFYQVRFVQRMFQAMVDSMELLQKCSTFSAPGVRLLYKMTELNVRALALHNSHGVLDIQGDNTAKKVFDLSNHLYDWRYRFINLEKIPTEIVSQFKIQSDQAENTLMYLRTYISPERYIS